MNEYLIVFFAALLLFNLPKFIGYVIRGLGLKEIKLTFAENNGKDSNTISFLESNSPNSALIKPKRSYLNKKKVGKLK